jgi:Predicted signal transduction protein with a C-terminal ATPase domain
LSVLYISVEAGHLQVKEDLGFPKIVHHFLNYTVGKWAKQWYTASVVTLVFKEKSSGVQMDSKRKTTFRKLMFSFIVLLIPIYALGFYAFAWSQRTVTNEITRSFAQQGEFYLTSLEREFASVQSLLYQCTNDEHLQKLVVLNPLLSEYEKYYSQKGLHQNMVRIRNSSVYISNVSVHIKELRKTVAANRTLSDITSQYYETIEAAIENTVAPFHYDDGRVFLSDEQQTSRRGSLYLLDAELNLKELRDSLAHFDAYQGSGSVLLGLPSGALFSETGEGVKIGEEIEEKAVSLENRINVVKVNGVEYLLVQSLSNGLGLTLWHYVPTKEILTPLSWLTMWIVVLTLTTLLLMILYSVYTRRMIQKPLNTLINSFERIERNDFSNRIAITRNDEFGYLYQRYNEMLDRLNELIDQNYRNKILTKEAQVKQLQSQINPHLLYNSLFIINTMAKTGDENLIPFSQYLGTYFRFMTRNARDVITLDEEIRHSRNYANLQEMRFKKRLVMRFDELPEKYSKVKIPRLTLQPIIENAFEYAVEKTAGQSVLNILFEEEMNSICIIIEENGGILQSGDIEALREKLDKEDDGSEVTGLMNVHRRLKFFYGNGLEVSHSKLGGLKVLIRIPFVK